MYETISILIKKKSDRREKLYKSMIHLLCADSHGQWKKNIKFFIDRMCQLVAISLTANLKIMNDLRSKKYNNDAETLLDAHSPHE